MATNEYTIQDSFDAANHIKDIEIHFYGDRYSFVSFDVESLFMNLSLKKTNDVILRRNLQWERDLNKHQEKHILL